MTNDAERVSDIVARLRNDQLPFCPFDSRSPLYWTAGENGAPCPVCHGTEQGPDLCRGADTRILSEAADIIEAQSKALAEAREALKPFAVLWDENLRDYPESDKSRGRPDDKQAWGFNNIDLTWGDFRRARAAIETEVDK